MAMEAVRAYQVAAGRLVVAEIEGVAAICLKAERQGKDFLNHYLVPLDPRPADSARLRLHYIDPDASLIPAAARLVVDAAEGRAAEVGDVVVNPLGRFLKVHDTAKTERHYAYVEVTSGIVRLRQEKGAIGVATWHLDRTVDQHMA